MKAARGLMVVMGVLAQMAGAAEEAFSRAVAPTDFSAAGLAKLTPEELARLDALVRDFKSGALEAARREAAAAAEAKIRAEAAAARAEADARTARAEAEAKAQQAVVAERKKNEGGLLARAKVLLTPGTEIEYATIESRIVGDFRGWDGRTVFQLENGQRWQSEGSSSYITTPVPGPAVKISPGALGAFYMTIDGVKPRVKVKLLK
jgi:hypothetical protein